MKLLYEDNCICVETWNDNDPVTSLSSVDADLPYTQVKLWDSGKIHVGEKCYWPHYINTIDVLGSAAFKIFKLVTQDETMYFLAFTRCITAHHLKTANIRKQVPPSL